MKYIFWPLSLAIGVPTEDCLSVGKLIGLKTFINEFVAYKELGATINFRNLAHTNNTYGMYKSGALAIPSDITMIWNVCSFFYFFFFNFKNHKI